MARVDRGWAQAFFAVTPGRVKTERRESFTAELAIFELHREKIQESTNWAGAVGSVLAREGPRIFLVFAGGHFLR
jgi:hypothetical protein